MYQLGIKISLLVFLAFSFLSCSQENKGNYSIERIYLRLMKAESMEGSGTFAKDGFAVYGLMLSDEKGQFNKNQEVLESLIIKGPDGNEFQKIKTDIPFAVSSQSGGSGYQVYGLSEQGILWSGLDLLLDMKTPPANGNYVFEATLKSGQKLSKTLNFEAYREDPIQGYATQIQFDEKSRTLQWKPSKGESGYRIGIYQGAKQGRVDPSKMIFTSETPKNSFVIPDSVVFHAGEVYYFVVDAFFSKTGKYLQANYIHHQDNDKELAFYNPQTTGKEAGQKKEPLALADVVYPYPVKYASVEGKKVAYIDEGKGTPILLLHGLSTDLNSFRPIYPALAEKGFRIIALDLIGYGKSDKPEIKHSIEFHAQTVLGFMKKINLKQAVILGHSMGGAIALLIAEKNPEKVKSLILLTPGGTYPLAKNAVFYYMSTYDSQYAKLHSDITMARSYFKEAVFRWNPLMEEFMEIRERSMLHPDWKDVLKTIKNSSISYMETNNQIAEKIGSIKLPVLAFYGTNDPTINARLAEENIRQNAKSWKVKILEECGHMIQYEQKDKTVQAILEFLDKNK